MSAVKRDASTAGNEGYFGPAQKKQRVTSQEIVLYTPSAWPLKLVNGECESNDVSTDRSTPVDGLDVVVHPDDAPSVRRAKYIEAEESFGYDAATLAVTLDIWMKAYKAWRSVDEVMQETLNNVPDRVLASRTEVNAKRGMRLMQQEMVVNQEIAEALKKGCMALQVSTAFWKRFTTKTEFARIRELEKKAQRNTFRAARNEQKGKGEMLLPGFDNDFDTVESDS
jgi:hypothetical protein